MSFKVGTSKLLHECTGIHAYSRTNARRSRRAPGVDEPGGGAVLAHLLGQHGRVLHGVPHQEGAAKARAECGLWLRHAHLRARHLASTTCLLWCGPQAAAFITTYMAMTRSLVHLLGVASSHHTLCLHGANERNFTSRPTPPRRHTPSYRQGIHSINFLQQKVNNQASIVLCALSTARLGGVAGYEVVHGLLAHEPRHGRQHSHALARVSWAYAG